MYYNTLLKFIDKIKTEENRRLLLYKIEKSNKLTFLERSELIDLTYSKEI